MMKKSIALILTLVLCLGVLAGCGSTSSSAAAGSAAGEDDWAYIQGNGVLKIGITIFDPMNYYDESGKLVGFDTELAEAVGEKLGVKVEFVEIDWDKKVLELQSKNIDCIWNGMTISEDLMENISFSMPYSENYQACVIAAKNADTYKDLASMGTARIGVEAGSAGESSVAAESALAGATVTPLAAQRNTLMEVKAGTLDVAVIDAVMAQASVGEGTDYADLMVVDGIELSKEEYGIGFRKGSTAVDVINNAIQELANDGFLAELQAKYPSVMVSVEAA